MLTWVLFALAVLVFALNLRESYTDPESPVVPPDTATIPPAWQSKIDAITPIGGDDMAYYRAIQAFYRRVYRPSATKPTDKDVENYLASGTSTPGIDPQVLRRLLATGFDVELTSTAAAREAKEAVTTGALAGFTGSNLQPGNARDEVYTRVENIYEPTDTEQSDRAAEGVYEETSQTEPTRTFESGTPFAAANVS